MTQAKSVGDILQAKQDNKVGIILGWQNTTPIENDLDRLALFYALGVRVVQITYNERNLLGNGCYERTDGGLSHFGVAAIREMNRCLKDCCQDGELQSYLSAHILHWFCTQRHSTEPIGLCPSCPAMTSATRREGPGDGFTDAGR